MQSKQPGRWTTALRCAALALALVGFGVLLRTQAWSQGNTGKDLFLANKCNMCHQISSQQVPRLHHEGDPAGTLPHDLSTVGTVRTSDFMVKFLSKEETIDGKSHPRKWAGSPEDLQTLAAWLATLK